MPQQATHCQGLDGLLIFRASVELFNMAAAGAHRACKAGPVTGQDLTPGGACHMVLRKDSDKDEIVTPGQINEVFELGGIRCH